MSRRYLRGSWVFGVGLLFVILVKPVLASSNNLVIHQVQPEGAVSVPAGTISPAKQEFISVYNNSDQPVDATNWCLFYSSSSDITKTKLGCLVPPNLRTRIMLDAHSSFTLATNEFVQSHATFLPDITFVSGLATASGHVRILDANGTEIDRLGWGGAINPETTSFLPSPSAGKILQRKNVAGSNVLLQETDNNSLDFMLANLTSLPASGLYEEIVPVDVCPNILGLQESMPSGYLADGNGDCQQDICANLEGLQTAVPEKYESVDGENCTLIPLENATILLTELLPNPKSYDTGLEFIELYNPNDRPISLADYSLQLGPSFAKSYKLPDDSTIAPRAYLAFTDAQTGLTLPNSAASVRLLAPAGNVVSGTDTYDQPAENISWSVINDVWQYTNQLTPNAANQAAVAGLGSAEADSDVSLTPCGDGKERNPETNRCRLIQLASAALTACKSSQERNPETGRCRSILASGGGLAACKAGQERNPETNRCRSSAAATLAACAAGQERNAETNRCRKVAGAATGKIAQVKDDLQGSIGNNPRWLLAGLSVTAALGYAAYEWRREVFGFLSGIKTKLFKI